MDNIKDNKYYVGKILKDLEFIIDNTSRLSKDAIVSNELLLDSIMFRLIQISENSNKLTNDFKNQHQDISWLSIKGMRNRLVHDYGEVDYSIIADTVLEDIPALYETLKSIRIN